MNVFEFLPNESFQMVYSFLSPYEQIMDSRVCKRWKESSATESLRNKAIREILVEKLRKTKKNNIGKIEKSIKTYSIDLICSITREFSYDNLILGFQKIKINNSPSPLPSIKGSGPLYIGRRLTNLKFKFKNEVKEFHPFISIWNPISFQLDTKECRGCIGDHKAYLIIDINKIVYKVNSVYIRTQIKLRCRILSSIQRKDPYLWAWNTWNQIENREVKPKNIHYLIEGFGQLQLKNYINRLALLNLKIFAEINTIEQVGTKGEYYYDASGHITTEVAAEKPMEPLSLIVESVLAKNEKIYFLNWRINEDYKQNSSLLDGLRWAVISKTIDKLAKKLKINMSNDAFLYKKEKMGVRGAGMEV